MIKCRRETSWISTQKSSLLLIKFCLVIKFAVLVKIKSEIKV